jgi:hypothetical protein
MPSSDIDSDDPAGQKGSGAPPGISFRGAREVEDMIISAFDECVAAISVWRSSGRRPPGIMDRLAAQLRPDLTTSPERRHTRRHGAWSSC